MRRIGYNTILTKPLVTSDANVLPSLVMQGTVAGDDGKEFVQASYAFLDDQDNVISDIYSTDSQGNYAINFPASFKWVNFYAPGYESTVFDVQDIIAANGVILHKKNNWWLLIVVGLLIAMATKKKKQVGSVSVSDVMPFMLIAAGLLTFNMIEKILQKLGLWTGPGQKGVDDESKNPDSPFKPGFWRAGGTHSYILDEDVAKSFAATLHGAFGLFEDDYNAVMSVFQPLRTQSEVSYLADIFNQVYGEDLLNFLTNGGGILPWDGLSDTHLNTIIQLVRALPKYVP